MQYRYDPEADAIYIILSDKPYAFGEDLDHERRIDYAADGTPIGVELTCVSAGVDVDNLPEKGQIIALLESLKIKAYA